jgi:error-prone DNA polymerase
MDGMLRRGYRREFAERLYRQILGFGDYGFPESHAASFALLVYTSAWLKHYYPAAFCAALLNSQPMGFYAPAQLVRDAREHGVAVRPADVNHSDWDCTLEAGPGAAGGPAMRLGLRQVRGLSHGGALRIAAARCEAPFADVPDLARRARLDRADLEALAAADTLVELAGHRHLAAWQVAGIERTLPLPHLDGFHEEPPGLAAPDAARSVIADYAQLGLSLRAHPLALVREALTERGFLSSDAVAQRSPGEVVRAAGLVLIRQRPGNGRAVFATIEDERGSLNLLIWADLAERQRRVLLGARLLGVVAEIQRADGVQHLVCRHLEDHTGLLAELRVVSRDFQ